jgi:hypothetical protein
MAMKRAELEEHCNLYDQCMASANVAEAAGLYRAALDAAMSAWQYIDGMMQYGRKYESRDFASVSAIDLVLKYAPFLLDREPLEALERLLTEKKRIERDTSDDMGERLAEALAELWDNHRLWTYLEMHPGTRQDELRQILGGDQAQWRSAAESWERMGLLRRSPESGSYRLALRTRVGQVVSGKCSACGHVVDAPKGMFFEPLDCPQCESSVLFVILGERLESAQEG